MAIMWTKQMSLMTDPHSPLKLPKNMLRLSCLRVLHQLAASTTCAEAMAATSIGTPQVRRTIYLMYLFVLHLKVMYSISIVKP